MPSVLLILLGSLAWFIVGVLSHRYYVRNTAKYNKRQLERLATALRKIHFAERDVDLILYRVVNPNARI